MSRADEQPPYCDFCDEETEHLTWYVNGRGGWLCDICAGTPAGNAALHWVARDRTDLYALKTIARTTHMILRAIKAQGCVACEAIHYLHSNANQEKSS